MPASGDVSRSISKGDGWRGGGGGAAQTVVCAVSCPLRDILAPELPYLGGCSVTSESKARIQRKRRLAFYSSFGSPMEEGLGEIRDTQACGRSPRCPEGLAGNRPLP